MNVFDTLMERGFIQQMTHEAEIRKTLQNESVTFYIGFDPTADSLTAGGFLTVMAMMHMQRAGHRPIVLVGGGTGMVGDPTDKSEMRKMMTREEVQHNVDSLKAQLSKYIDFSEGKAIMVDNAEWLLDLKYVPFIREYGVHFSVNRMLTADAYRTRFERGLTFFEFNYMLMQSYDFLELYRRYNCKMQLGGNDQWSNIIGGVELIRKVESADAYGMTFSLLTTSEGVKMGKSLQGAIWLDPAKTSPYEFYQYWRNIDDTDVGNCLSLLTLLPMDEVYELKKLEGKQLNRAKEILAYEVTKLVHSEKDALEAQSAAKALFSGGQAEGSVPMTEISAAQLGQGIGIIELLETAKLIPSRGEGRRLIQQGGIRVGDKKIESFEHVVKPEHFNDGTVMIQKGKKVFHLIKMVE